MNTVFKQNIFSRFNLLFIPILVYSIIVFTACQDDMTEEAEVLVEEEKEVENILTEGFLINVQTPNDDHIVKYFEDLPSGSANMSDGQTFTRFFPRDLYNSAIFLAKPDGTNFFSKITVDTTGTIVESGTISVTGDNPVTIKVVDDSTGLLHDRNSSTVISVFNPTSMEIEGSIDMSAGAYSDQKFQTFHFVGDEVFAPLRPEVGGTYDQLIVQSVNFRTGQYLNTTEYATGSTFPRDEFGDNNVDEQGNVYVVSYGNPAGGQPVASIHKIPAGSTTFDEDYNFIPALVANPDNTLLPTFGGFNYYKDDIGYAVIATSVPQELIDLVISVGGNPADLSDTQRQEALGILFAAENGNWAKINLVDQTVEIIEDIPSQSSFSQTSFLEKDGYIYLSATNSETNAFYKYDPDTGSASKAFDITGGSLIGMYDLSQNH